MVMVLFNPYILILYFYILNNRFCLHSSIFFSSQVTFICIAFFITHSFFISFTAGVLSLMGNTTLLFVAYRKKSSLKPAEFFIINLSISDLGMTIFLFPFAIPSSLAHR